MSKIDKLDFQIVELLMEDGRMACTEIARRIGGITERSVRYRINRMLERGLILITAIPNQALLGYTVVADVFIEVEPGRIKELTDELAAYPRVTYAAYAIGDNDVSIQIVARSNEEVYAFVTGVIGGIPGVRKTTTSIVPHVVKDVHEWHIPLEDCECDPGEGPET